MAGKRLIFPKYCSTPRTSNGGDNKVSPIPVARSPSLPPSNLTICVLVFASSLIIHFLSSIPKSLLFMLFFFPNHLQVSEIMSRFSLLDYFRWLSSGWGLRFSLHHKVSSTLPPPLMLFCPSQTLCLLDCVPGGSTAMSCLFLSWGKFCLPVGSTTISCLFFPLGRFCRPGGSTGITCPFFPRGKFCLPRGSTGISCLNFL